MRQRRAYLRRAPQLKETDLFSCHQFRRAEQRRGNRAAVLEDGGEIGTPNRQARSPLIVEACNGQAAVICPLLYKGAITEGKGC
jgi:hypothetical protein